MTEFALVAPMLFFLLLGILDSSLLMFSSATTRLAAATASRLGSQMGNRAAADDVMKQAVVSTGLTTNLYTLSSFEVRKQTLSGSTLTDSPTFYDRYPYQGGGTWGACICNWLPAGRNVIEGQSDFMKVTLFWTYAWKSGLLLNEPSLNLQTSYSIRLEPQELAP